MFDVQTHLSVFPSKPGEVFDDDQIDFFTFDVLQHPFELWTVEVGPAPPIVAIVVSNFYVVFLAVLGQQSFLCLDAA